MAKTATRSQWKGSITFGMVTIPVKMYGGAVAEDVKFSQFHDPAFCSGPEKPGERLERLLRDLTPFMDKALADHPDDVDGVTGLQSIRGQWNDVNSALIDLSDGLDAHADSGAANEPGAEVPLATRKVGRKEVCAFCQEEVERLEIQRGYVVSKDQVVAMDPEDFTNLPVPTLKTIQVMEFVDESAIDQRYLEKPYLLSPDEAGGKAFALLLRGMEAEKRAAVAKLSMRNREHLVVIRPRGTSLLLHTLYHDDEIRTAPDVALPEVSEQELDLAGQLIGALHGDWDVTKYSDDYRTALMARIEAKVSGLPIEVEEMPAPQPVADLTAGLLASIQAVKAEAA